MPIIVQIEIYDIFLSLVNARLEIIFRQRFRKDTRNAALIVRIIFNASSAKNVEATV